MELEDLKLRIYSKFDFVTCFVVSNWSTNMEAIIQQSTLIYSLIREENGKKFKNLVAVFI